LLGKCDRFYKNSFLQQFAFQLTTNKNIKPIAGLFPATLPVASLINNCCKSLASKVFKKAIG